MRPSEPEIKSETGSGVEFFRTRCSQPPGPRTRREDEGIHVTVRAAMDAAEPEIRMAFDVSR